MLIKWLGKDEGEATWESLENIKLHFPEADLEDKVNVKGGSNVEIGKFSGKNPVLQRGLKPLQCLLVQKPHAITRLEAATSPTLIETTRCSKLCCHCSEIPLNGHD